MKKGDWFYMNRLFGWYLVLQYMLADRSTKPFDVVAGDEFETDHADAGNVELEFCIDVQQAGCLNGKSLDFIVWDGSIIFFLAAYTLYINADDPFVGKHQTIPHANIAVDDLLAWN